MFGCMDSVFEKEVLLHSFFSYRMPDHRPPLFRRDPSGIRKIDFMVHPAVRKIVFISLIFKKIIHQR